MLKGFKEFISQGNAIDLAVGVVIGAAFGAVITSLTDSFLNPLIGAIFGQPDFTNVLQFSIATPWGEPAVVQPGAVFTALLNFLIVAFALYFFVVLPINKLNSKSKEILGVTEEEEEAPVSDEVALLMQIRDALVEQDGQSTEDAVQAPKATVEAPKAD